jgi:hypothetical protein
MLIDSPFLSTDFSTTPPSNPFRSGFDWPEPTDNILGHGQDGLFEQEIARWREDLQKRLPESKARAALPEGSGKPFTLVIQIDAWNIRERDQSAAASSGASEATRPCSAWKCSGATIVGSCFSRTQNFWPSPIINFFQMHSPPLRPTPR